MIVATCYNRTLVTFHISVIIMVFQGTLELNVEFFPNRQLPLAAPQPLKHPQPQTHLIQSDNKTLTGTHPLIPLHTLSQRFLYTKYLLNGTPLWSSTLKFLQHYFTLFIDTGTSVNIMSTDCFNKIRSTWKKCFVIEPPEIQLFGINGTTLNTAGKIPLDTNLSPDLLPVSLIFYIVHDINIPADALIGRPSLTEHSVVLVAGRCCYYWWQGC